MIPHKSRADNVRIWGCNTDVGVACTPTSKKFLKIRYLEILPIFFKI
jgi:hypothetical protein